MIFLIIDTIEWRKFLINKNEKKILHNIYNLNNYVLV